MTVDATAFSINYPQARSRFRQAIEELSAGWQAWSVGSQGPDGEECTIDVARIGPKDAKRLVVVSSGLHGVEGFLGSAIQLAVLQSKLLHQLPDDTAVLMLHGLNPFGFAWLRRVDADNTDLNRNFLTEGEYAGAPKGYRTLNSMLNPKRGPGKVSAFLPKALFKILVHGMPALKDAVAGGQYEYSTGLFFGGHKPSPTQLILDRHLETWLGNAENILHIDIHSGLGKRGSYACMVDHRWGSLRLKALTKVFGDVVEPWEPKKGVSYQIRGGLGEWCKWRFPKRTYDVLCTEFGTEPILTVISALHQENRAWHHADRDGEAAWKARWALRDVFAPRDRQWRDEVVAKGYRVLEQAIFLGAEL